MILGLGRADQLATRRRFARHSNVVPPVSGRSSGVPGRSALPEARCFRAMLPNIQALSMRRPLASPEAVLVQFATHLQLGQPRYADARAQRPWIRGDRRARGAQAQLGAPRVEGIQKDPVVCPLSVVIARQRPIDTRQPPQPRWRCLGPCGASLREAPTAVGIFSIFYSFLHCLFRRFC